ncbi:alpha-galactosidase [Chitinophaga sp. SYP-B3965]|uniref:alpha-galactosidase n=1 Tax=Chitinophaga sp. SYP-B3965 TaxID=2663120 RepID=UPI001299CFEF|nr:alpha-galactosidase [Chitinophaga sp. SYP-B3965]MRG47156.1 alpha-galactosidase [Chitinophaga sp. SYP-B3965]
MKWFTVIAAMCLSFTVQAQHKTIPFGKNGRIVYNLQNGTYSVWMEGKEVIKDAFAFYDEEQRPDTGQAVRSFAVSPVKNGKQYVISSGTQRQHVFYVYNGTDGFYTALILKGKGARSRYMSPLTGKRSGFTSAVVVPFDNDAWVKYKVADLQQPSFTSSEVTALYDSVRNNGLIIGSVEHNNWKTGISVSGNNISAIAGWTDSTGTRDRIKHGIVTQGDSLCISPKILVLATTDWRTGMEQYGSANRLAEPHYIHQWTAAKPFGWNSWGSIQAKLSLAKAKKVVDFFADSCKTFRSKDGQLYIDLDSYWDNMTQAELAAFVTYCKEKGLKAGIYWAPFVDWGKHATRKVEGSNYTYQETWTKAKGEYHDFDGARAMDPTHPATKERITYRIKQFKDAGFEMIKIDFIGHAAIEADTFFDPAVHTGLQAFRKGMEFLVDQLDGKMLVYAAISPNLATGRYVHMRRIACDAYKSIQETAYTLNGTSLGWWQNKVYDFADADHVVFADETPGANRARLTSAIVTGTLITGDDYSVHSSASSAAQQLLQNPDLLKVAQQEGIFRPIDHHTGETPSNMFMTTGGKYTYLAVVNYSNQPATFVVDLPYKSKELFSGKTVSQKGKMSITVNPADAVIYRLSK